MTTHEEEFSKWYSGCSGHGSSLEYTETYRQFLQDFIREHNVKSIVDLGCGDMVVMGALELDGVNYVGVDCIALRIQLNAEKYPSYTFVHSDIREFEIPKTDLIVCKDVLQHWPHADVVKFLEKIKRLKTFKYALFVNDTNNSKNVNLHDINVASCRSIDITSDPFNFGEQVMVFHSKAVVLFKQTA